MRRLPSLLLPSLLLAGCFHDEVPAGANLSCASDLDCPPGLECSTEVERCIDPNGDTKPPALYGLAQIAPAIARVGLPVVILFEVNEDLFSAPRVHVGGREASLDEAESTRKRFRFVLDPDGTEPQDAPVPVTIDLLDSNGNLASGLLAGSVSFDFVAPAIVGDPKVAIAPPPRSLVDPVASVGVGATVSVELAFDEALGGDPVVEAVWEEAADPATPEPDEVLTFLRRGGGPTSFTFEHVLVATAARPQGRYVLRTRAHDAVGNEGAATLQAGFEVDTLRPAEPDVLTEGRIVYRREPWGSEAGGGARRMSLQAVGGAVGPRDLLLVFAHDPHGELGRAAADDKGAAQVSLLWADLPKVWVQAVDAAGNASAEVAVRDLEWVATLGGKVAGSDDENPHELVSRSWMGSGLLGRIGPGYGAYPQSGDALARVDVAGPPTALTALRQSGEPAWARRDPRRWPWFKCNFGDVTINGAVFAYDLAHEQAVVLSGDGKTWVYDGTGFRQVLVADPEGDGEPSPRCGASLVYDERRGEVVLATSLGSLGETWVWNGASWRFASAGLGPTARSMAATAYDRERGEVVVFGGSPLLAGMREDTWVWDGRRWTERKPAHRPPKRYGAGLTWDPASKALLLFGGLTTDNGFDEYPLDDLWRWDGTDWTQVAKPAAGAWPPARTFGAMLTDEARKKVLLFGGSADKHVADDLALWEWDGSAWTSRTLGPNALDLSADPRYGSGRLGFAAAYDRARKKVVLMGGFVMPKGVTNKKDRVPKDDLWEWDPLEAAWKDLTPTRDPVTGLPVTPGVRLGASLAHDPVSHKVLMFGGADRLDDSSYDFGNPLDDLWSWDGVGWVQLPHASPWPVGRGAANLAWDSKRGAMVMFGGWAAPLPPCDTWEWTGVWRQASLMDLGSPCITTSMATFDHQGSAQTVRFGGFGVNLAALPSLVLERSDQTSIWGGASWSVVTPTAAPAERDMAAMAPDGQGGAILFGGEISSGANPEPEPFYGWRRNDTWRWDGTTWTCLQPHDPLLAPPGRPEARVGHSVTLDVDRGRPLLADGWGAGPMSDYWEWDVATQAWVRRYPINPSSGELPTPALYRGGAYDPDRKRFVFFGGQTATDSCDELWELDMGVGQRPGQVFSVSLARSGIPADVVLTRVEVKAVAGGRGSDTVGGVELWGWTLEGWQTLASEPAALPEAPAAVSAQIDGAAQLATLRFQDGLHFALVPRGTNTARPAEVVTDYVEATVRYRL